MHIQDAYNGASLMAEEYLITRVTSTQIARTLTEAGLPDARSLLNAAASAIGAMPAAPTAEASKSLKEQLSMQS